MANSGLGKADGQILRELQRDGMASNLALGHSANLSESAAARHRHRLEREGYIKRYAAVVDVERLGYGETAFVLLGLASQQEYAQEEFEAAVEKIEEVMECHAVVGERVDYLIRVVARDTHDYERIRHRLAALPGVEHMHTHTVLHDVLQREVLLPPLP